MLFRHSFVKDTSFDELSLGSELDLNSHLPFFGTYVIPKQSRSVKIGIYLEISKINHLQVRASFGHYYIYKCLPLLQLSKASDAEKNEGSRFPGKVPGRYVSLSSHDSFMLMWVLTPKFYGKNDIFALNYAIQCLKMMI